MSFCFGAVYPDNMTGAMQCSSRAILLSLLISKNTQSATARQALRPRQGGVSDSMTNTENLEEKIAHLTRSVDDLSDIIARQDKELALLTRRVALLMEREATRDLDAGGSVALADQRPPHW